MTWSKRSLFPVLIALAACSPEPTAQTTAAASRAPVAGDDTITLITGDRVQLTAGGPVVSPAPGRGAVAFAISREHDDIFVTPSDVAPRIAAHRLDRALFDVTRLLAEGYGDRRRADLPLIVEGSAGFAPAIAAGAIVDRVVPSAHAIAVRQPKGRPLVAGGGRIWLDRKRRLTLDHSVPQIGGPAAHARGLTGAGVTVAVIDSGVDSTHPDLADRVIAAEDFTGDGGGVLDVFGHGTHVASIIAGTGAASGGQFAGVAPGAHVISGRACDAFGDCTESALLAAIEWAVVDQHAPIVNLSVGGSDTPEIDPLEDLINTLSAQHGTLFVISAGNDGADGTINSPGSADAALAVGAVDRDDQLASFSSRGPRIGDHAIKPDLTAPGVDIAAALATGPEPIGEVVDTAYQRLSGTSMAAPHVAGAAALVRQQHPEWTGAELKAQLIGAAQPTAGLTAFEQGAGRVDVDRATRQAVTAEPASLSLGVALFPHGDDPALIRTVTYHNAGAAPITLALAATLALPGGTTPPGLLALGAASVTVPAGGTASVAVTVDTAADVPDGDYTGAIVATAGDVRIETPIAVEREVESYDIELRVIGADGAPGAASVFIQHGHDAQLRLLVDGATTVRLPRQIYAIDAFNAELPLFYVSLPRFDANQAQTVTLDGRVARAPSVTLPDPAATVDGIVAAYHDARTDHMSIVIGPSVMLLGHLGPELPAAELVSWQVLDLQGATPQDHYEIAHAEAGHAITGSARTLGARDLSIEQARYAPDAVFTSKSAIASPEDSAGRVLGGGGFSYDVPNDVLDVTEHYAGVGFGWIERVGAAERVMQYVALRRHRPGTRSVESWNQPTFGPGFPDRLLPAADFGRFQATSSATRDGDTLALRPSMEADRGEHATREFAYFFHARLLRDGTEIPVALDRSLATLAPVVVPPGPATYRLEIDEDSEGFEALSTRITAAWTFPSSHTAGREVLPLPVLRYEPALDRHGQTAARVIALPIRFERPPGAAKPAIREATLEVSFDDGATWRHVPLIVLGDRGVALIVHPAAPSFVSLRGTARDVRGNAVEQTILRVYGVTP